MNKKRLVLHHDVRSTDFLKPFYAHLSSKTVVHHFVEVDVRALIHSHERVIMLSHGYLGSMFNMVDDSHASLLRQKKDNIYIWCNADQFVKKHGLSGLTTGMFISETKEAMCSGIPADAYLLSTVTYSNDLFARLVAQKSHAPLQELHTRLLKHYQPRSCQIIQFNRERIQLIKPAASDSRNSIRPKATNSLLECNS